MMCAAAFGFFDIHPFCVLNFESLGGASLSWNKWRPHQTTRHLCRNHIVQFLLRSRALTIITRAEQGGQVAPGELCLTSMCPSV